MTNPRISVVGLTVLFLATCGWGQEVKPTAPAATPAGAKLESVLSHIPADALGFVVVGNAGDLGRKADKLLADLGVDQFLAKPSPDDPQKMIKTPVLDVLKGLAQLGPGFNPNGGVAAIMLDPKAYGINIVELMKGTKKPAADATTPPAGGAAAPEAKPKVPFVIFVPGTGVKEVFGAYKMAPSGKYTLVELRMGPTFAGQVGGYVVLSPNEKALDAVMSAQKMADTALPAEQAAVIAKGDLAYYINMKLAQPLMADILKQVQEQATAEAGPGPPLVAFYMDFYRQMLSQMDSIVVAGRLGETGIVFEEMVSMLPDSAYGKAMLANKDAGKAQLSSLPNLPYVLAIGSSAGGATADKAKLATDMIDGLLKMDPLSTLADADKQALVKMVRDITDEVTGAEIVLGGAPAGKGLFGADFVIHCKDAEKMKGMLAEQAKLGQNIFRHLGKDDADVQKLTIRYVPKMETIGSVSADAIVLDSPKLGDMKEDERTKMKKVLGEDKVRFLIASPDKNTVIVTFGGTADFMGEALKAAGGKGTIGTDPAAAEAMKNLPANCNGLVLINAGNLFDLIMAGAKTMAPDEELPPFKLACKVPIALGSGVTGSSAHVVIYVPTQLIKEIAGTVMMFAGGAMPGGGAPPAAKPPVGGKDF
jgi:hypothetical protein